ncbi:MAG TPA: N-methyl-L-tryptophan oxidase [Nocardioidaceae bacterium]|nr:N-methyl-L-tryptophan oxidase [Nocardioidaceae bacterium]
MRAQRASKPVDYVVAGLGALGSATCWELARRGHSVVGLERFELGHARGASHDTSRILRHSYHTPSYVRLTQAAYFDWARLEQASGTALVTKVGGLDLFPPDPAIAPIDYTQSLDEVGIPYEALDSRSVAERWPQFRLPEGTLALYQADAAIVPAGLGTRVMQQQARRLGAELHEHAAVLSVRDLGSEGVEVDTAHGTIKSRGLVVCADAWVNDVLTHLDVEVPVEVTLEQVTYFDGVMDDIPLWIWMDDPSYYGFPSYGEATVKAAQDCGGPSVYPESRTFEPDARMEAQLASFLKGLLPGVGRPIRSVRCQYTLTPDRDFVISAVPGHESVVVGLGAAHGFKFAPTFGRLLADLVVDGTTSTDLTAYRMDRPALTDPNYQAHWLV